MKVIITGASGMVGEGVMLECLAHPDVEQVLIINRKTAGHTHPKLREILHADFFDLKPIEAELKDYNACFFCAGVSSVGRSKEEYQRVTYDLTVSVARSLEKLNPATTFCYVSGKSTDSSEHGKVNWARVKGATENELMRIFKNAYMFRPAMMKRVPGQKNAYKGYQYFEWIYYIGRPLFPNLFCTLNEVGLAMINASRKGYPQHILEVPDIVALSKA